MSAHPHAIRIAAAALGLLLAAWPTAGQAPSSRAASALFLPEPDSRPTLLPVLPAATVDEALAYTDGERTILEDVNDRDSTIWAPALYVLMRRAAMLPTDPGILGEADQPTVKNLWASPERYRTRFVRVTGRFLTMEDASREIMPNLRWAGSAHVMWLVEMETKAKSPEKKAGRIMVVLTRKPPREPALAREITVAGIYYKLVRLPKRDSGGYVTVLPASAPAGPASMPALPPGMEDCPIIVAGSLFRAGSGSGGGVSNVPPVVMGMFGLVLLMVVGFILIKRKTRRPATATGTGDYTPVRFEDAANGLVEDAPDDGPVDEDLVRQAEAFRAARGLTTDTDDADHEDNSR